MKPLTTSARLLAFSLITLTQAKSLAIQINFHENDETHISDSRYVNIDSTHSINEKVARKSFPRLPKPP